MCCLGFIPVESLAVAFLALVCLFKFDELSFLLDFFSTVSQKKLFKLRLSQCPAMSAPPHLSCVQRVSLISDGSPACCWLGGVRGGRMV